MRIMFLCFVLLFSQEVTSVRSPNQGKKKVTFVKRVKSNPSLQHSKTASSSPSEESSFNPCVKAKTTKDANKSCQSHCLKLGAEIKVLQKHHPFSMSVNFLNNKCGMVIGGRCSSAFKPVCSCDRQDPSKGVRRVSFPLCNYSLQTVKKLPSAPSPAWLKLFKRRNFGNLIEKQDSFNEAKFYQFTSGHPSSLRQKCNCPRCPTSLAGFRLEPNSPPRRSPSPRGEEDWNFRPDSRKHEGSLLWTDLRLSDKIIRCRLDTGSSFSMIRKDLINENDIVSFEKTSFISANNHEHTIEGQITVDLELRPGITIKYTAMVTNQEDEILLGNDFFSAFAAKIDILNREMKLIVKEETVELKLRFRPSPPRVSMMNIDRTILTSLEIEAFFNGHETRVLIDTGASVSIANQNFVEEDDMYPVATKCSFGGCDPVKFKGASEVSLLIGSIDFTFQAYVPEFIPPVSLIAGNNFIKSNVEMIDYKSETVSFVDYTYSGKNRVKSKLFIRTRVRDSNIDTNTYTYTDTDTDASASS